MIFIRADANKEIGSGHVMRCLSIAAALKQTGKEVCFLVADEEAGALLEACQQRYTVLHSDYSDMEGELGKLREIFESASPELMLIDSYYVTEHYLRETGKITRTAYVDDIPLFAYPVDMLINYNIYGKDLDYEATTASAGKDDAVEKQLLLGASYAPVREQFCNVNYELRPRVENVLVTTGGSDKYNLAEMILKELLGREDTGKLQYHVVSGIYNPHFRRLEELKRQHPGVHLYQNVTDMAGLMKKCDVAITAGGSTVYELCAVGVPMLCFSFVDNQRKIVDSLRDGKLVEYGGNYTAERECFAGNIADALERLMKSEQLRKQYSDAERRLVDGKGAQRIAEAVKFFIEKEAYDKKKEDNK